jgi:hypothetical protein
MPNKRNLKDYGFLVLKGMGMGAAGCRSRRVGRNDRLYRRYLRGTDRLYQKY